MKVRGLVTMDIETEFDDDESTTETLLCCILEDLSEMYTVYDAKIIPIIPKKSENEKGENENE